MNQGVVGSILALVAVILGAFSAHALKDQFNIEQKEWFQTATFYLWLHAFSILISSLIQNHWSKIAFYFFVGGVLLFSGSLYILAFSQVRKWGMVTPFGGLSFIIGWVFMALSFAKR